ncbi:MAG: DUF5991 domain-containing protein, partial [Bacteroidota bacterium]|nr:DUF5991 domain-containing protein [Bacteroidota bacterium]
CNSGTEKNISGDSSLLHDSSNATKSHFDSSKNSWYGQYEYYLPGPNIGGVNIGWEYNIVYNDTECTFHGDGYQMGFKYRCEPIYNDDTLYLKEVVFIGDGENTPVQTNLSTIIIKVGNEYYFQSKTIAEEGIAKPTECGYKMKKLK